jgi:group II intron reverse transcriptase/maturase
MERTMTGTSRPETGGGATRDPNISTKLQRIATLAREDPKRVLTTLAHHIDVEWLMEAYRLVRKDGATGVDGQTAADYERDLKKNLESLLDRFKSGTYRAPPVRRVHIPKGDGRTTRPIGVPTIEDKVLQRAVTMAMEAVYEQDFLACSFGFRPGRSAHQALECVWKGVMNFGGGWVLEADIKSFFDRLDHGLLRSILNQRVHDGVLRKTIDKWLKAGVLEQGNLWHPDAGTPQGGVISPLLANIYLHEVLDVWFEQQVKPVLRGRAFLVRYADDFVIVFETKRDAERVLAVLPKRFGKYGLALHPEKTQLVRFTRPPHRGKPRGDDRPGTFYLLGFTHYWGRSRKGYWVVQRKTAKSSLTRAVRKIHMWCKRNRHLKIAVQHKALCRKLQGHDAYYGITGNARSLTEFRKVVERAWKKWLCRRSHANSDAWEWFHQVKRRYPLPPVRVVHSIYRVANP